MTATDTLVLYPGASWRGHLIEFGKLIQNHHPEFSITVIISIRPGHKTPENLQADYPSFSFHYLPPTANAVDSGRSSSILSRQNNQSLHTALSAISESTNIRVLIFDFLNVPAIGVAAERNIPTYCYYTSCASALIVHLHLPTLFNTLPCSLKDLGSQQLQIPGLQPIPASDFPDTFSDPTSALYQDTLEIGECLTKTSGIIINTCESLEPRALAAIRDGSLILDGPTPPLYTVGPVVDTKDVGYHADRHESLQWLDSQPRRSVVFLCFGSIGVLSPAQLKEVATGLERSRVRFLWVVRPPSLNTKTGTALSLDDTLTLDSVLPEGFLERTRHKGLVVKSWAPQVDVLRHGSVGGFVNHCGWNSILEALSAEVPMVTWPLYAEQRVNRSYLVDEAKIAIRLADSDEGLVSANELETRVNELMSLERGKEERSCHERHSCCRHGCSRDNLAKLAEIFKQN